MECYDESVKAVLGDKQQLSYLKALNEMEEGNFNRKVVNKLGAQLRSIMQGTDPAEQLKGAQEYMDAPLLTKAGKVAQEVHVRSLLSGIHTLLVNASGGLMMTVFSPLERILGGIARGAVKTATGNIAEARNSFRAIGGDGLRSIHIANDFLQATIVSLNRSGRGKAFLSAPMTEVEHFSALRHIRQQVLGNSLFSRAVGLAVDYPMEFLEEGDKIMKIANGMSEARRFLREDMLKQGVDPAMISSKVEEQLQVILKAQGNMTELTDIITSMRSVGLGNQDIENIFPVTKGLTNIPENDLMQATRAAESGRAYGQTITHTNDLRDDGLFGKTAQALQGLIGRNPIFRFVFPFVRTPVSLADYAWDRTIGPMYGAAMKTLDTITFGKFNEIRPGMSRFEQALRSSDPQIANEAYGRFITASGFMIGAWSLVTRDRQDGELPAITGSGPTDPEVRAALERAGWQPFSLRIGDEYVSYGRLDPLGTQLGIFVDAAEYFMENEDDGDLIDQAMALSLASAVGLAQNLGNKTYAQTARNLLNAMMDPDNRGEALVGSLMGSFVPTIVSDTRKNVDPYTREIESAFGRLRSRIPGLSSRNRIRRDILGQPMQLDHPLLDSIVPVRIAKIKDKTLEGEMARFAYGFTPPKTTKGGVDLLDESFSSRNQVAYDRYLELYGQVKIGGRDIRQALRKEVARKSYQKLDPGEGPNGENSERVYKLNNVMARYRRAAWKQLLKENPTLKQATKDAATIRRRRRRGLTIEL